MDTQREILTPEQVAEYLQLDRETIYRYIRNGKLIASKFGRQYRISRENVDRFFRSSSTRPEFQPREYSKEEIEQFLIEDQIDEETARAFKQAVANLR